MEEIDNLLDAKLVCRIENRQGRGEVILARSALNQMPPQAFPSRADS
jgi:hypothetical protein